MFRHQTNNTSPNLSPPVSPPLSPWSPSPITGVHPMSGVHHRMFWLPTEDYQLVGERPGSSLDTKHHSEGEDVAVFFVRGRRMSGRQAIELGFQVLTRISGSCVSITGRIWADHPLSPPTSPKIVLHSDSLNMEVDGTFVTKSNLPKKSCSTAMWMRVCLCSHVRDMCHSAMLQNRRTAASTLRFHRRHDSLIVCSFVSRSLIHQPRGNGQAGRVSTSACDARRNGNRMRRDGAM